MTTELLLSREKQTADATIGRFFWGMEALYYTLEPPQRAVKIKGITAAPVGRYQILMQWSPRFQQEMPHLQDVPEAEGVLIHWGNFPKDTEECILIGLGQGNDSVTQSKAAFSHFVPRLEQALLHGDVWLTIISAIPITL